MNDVDRLWPSRFSGGGALIGEEVEGEFPARFQEPLPSAESWLEETREWGMPQMETTWPARFKRREDESPDDELVVVTNHQSVLPKVLPDVKNGLGRSLVKQDLVALEDFLCGQAVWGVFDKQLCHYQEPCWKRLDHHDAEVSIRRILADFGFDRYLASGDYRELRRMLMVNPALQMGQKREPPQYVVNLLDCTLDLSTGECRSHDPEDGLFHFLNMTSGQIMNPPSGDTFERFVGNLSGGDPDVRRQLLELVALLIANRQIKAFFVMLGPSNTGKTQFGRFLTELLGHEQVETLRGMDDFSDKWTMGALMGKRMVTCLDLPDYPLSTKAVGAIKQLVGDDAVKGEYKRGSLFTFYDKPLLVCAGNHPIRVPNAEREEALLNRLVIIPFHNPVLEEEMEDSLYKRLLAEAPYIVSQALETWQELAARNFVLTRTEVPAEYRTAEGNDRLKAVQAFAEKCLTHEPDAEVTTAALLAAFRASPVAVEMSSVDFARLFAQAAQGLSADIVPIKRVAGLEQRGYRGLRLCNYSE